MTSVADFVVELRKEIKHLESTLSPYYKSSLFKEEYDVSDETKGIYGLIYGHRGVHQARAKYRKDFRCVNGVDEFPTSFTTKHHVINAVGVPVVVTNHFHYGFRQRTSIADYTALELILALQPEGNVELAHKVIDYIKGETPRLYLTDKTIGTVEFEFLG